jgi:hypothetical protein
MSKQTPILERCWIPTSTPENPRPWPVMARPSGPGSVCTNGKWLALGHMVPVISHAGRRTGRVRGSPAASSLCSCCRGLGTVWMQRHAARLLRRLVVYQLGQHSCCSKRYFQDLKPPSWPQVATSALGASAYPTCNVLDRNSDGSPVLCSDFGDHLWNSSSLTGWTRSAVGIPLWDTLSGLHVSRACVIHQGVRRARAVLGAIGGDGIR